MCRNIKSLFNFEPSVTDEEIRESSLQFVRKISGFNKLPKVNEKIFNTAIHEISLSTRKFIDSLVTDAKPRNREEENKIAHEKALIRFGKV